LIINDKFDTFFNNVLNYLFVDNKIISLSYSDYTDYNIVNTILKHKYNNCIINKTNYYVYAYNKSMKGTVSDFIFN